MRTLIKAMPQVHGEWQFLTPCGTVALEVIELKFGMTDYVQHATPHAKIGGRRTQKGGGLGYGRSCHLACLFTSNTHHSVLGQARDSLHQSAQQPTDTSDDTTRDPSLTAVPTALAWPAARSQFPVTDQARRVQTVSVRCCGR